MANIPRGPARVQLGPGDLYIEQVAQGARLLGVDQEKSLMQIRLFLEDDRTLDISMTFAAYQKWAQTIQEPPDHPQGSPDKPEFY